MRKLVEGMENPDHEWKCGLYNSDHNYVEEDWHVLTITANTCIENRMVAEFIRIANEFQCEAGIRPNVLHELDLANKYLVVGTECLIRLQMPGTVKAGLYHTRDHRFVNSMLAFSGIDPDHLYDLELIREVLPDNKGFELTVKLKFNIKPTTAFKYILKGDDDV